MVSASSTVLRSWHPVGLTQLHDITDCTHNLESLLARYVARLELIVVVVVTAYQEPNANSLAQAQELGPVSCKEQSAYEPSANTRTGLRNKSVKRRELRAEPIKHTLSTPPHELDALLGELGGNLQQLLNLVGHYDVRVKEELIVRSKESERNEDGEDDEDGEDEVVCNLRRAVLSPECSTPASN